MLKTIQVCDRCSRECPYESVYAIVGEQRLPTGESTDSVAAIDLCPLCMRWVMQEVVNAMRWDEAAQFIAAHCQPLKPGPK